MCKKLFGNNLNSLCCLFVRFRKTLYQVFDDMYTMAVEASAAAAKKGKAQL